MQYENSCLLIGLFLRIIATPNEALHPVIKRPCLHNAILEKMYVCCKATEPVTFLWGF
jgi:hypothetical protein